MNSQGKRQGKSTKKEAQRESFNIEGTKQTASNKAFTVSYNLESSIVSEQTVTLNS